MSSKKQLLDPVGTMCRLIFLNFEDRGTKIGINSHTITIYPSSYLQMIIRKYYGENKDHISELYISVVRIIEWYIVPLHEIVNNNDAKIMDTFEITKEDAMDYWECMYKLCTYLCRALGKLQETYVEGNIIFCLQFYINLIEDGLNGKYTDKKLPKCKIINDSLLDYEKIRILWNYKKVKDLCELYDKCFETEHDNSESKDEKIRGYLLAIDKLLSISDDAFKKMIEYSNQG